MQKPGATILCYLALTAGASSLLWTLMIVSGHVGAGNGAYVTGLMWCPAVAAVATVYIRRLDFKMLGLRWGGARIFGFGFFPNTAAIAAIAQKLGWSVGADCSRR